MVRMLGAGLLLWQGNVKGGLEISKSPVYNQEKEGTQMQDLMPSVKIISKIEIASLTLDGVGCYFLLCRSM